MAINTVPDLVIAGGGPIGLWTACQIIDKKPDAKITILEKYQTYKRAHHLIIDKKSLPKNIGVNSKIYDVVKFLRDNPRTRTNEIEGRLLEVAQNAGITILRGEEHAFKSKEDLLSRFPETKLFIGADGARSLFRKHIFGETSKNRNLEYISEMKYSIKGRAKKIDPASMFWINQFTRMYNQRYVGSYDPVTDTTPVTIRTMVTEKDYKSMEGWTTFANPKTYNDLRKKVPAVYEVYKRWLRRSEDVPQGSSKITITKINYYKSGKMVKFKGDRSYCLIGDAAFGVPFFRSMNNGSICGTKLAGCVVRHLKNKKNALVDFQRYIQNRSRWEIFVAVLKDIFIKIYVFFLYFLKLVIGYSVSLSFYDIFPHMQPCACPKKLES